MGLQIHAPLPFLGAPLFGAWAGTTDQLLQIGGRRVNKPGRSVLYRLEQLSADPGPRSSVFPQISFRQAASTDRENVQIKLL